MKYKYKVIYEVMKSLVGSGQQEWKNRAGSTKILESAAFGYDWFWTRREARDD